MYLYYYINPCQPHSISIYPFQFIQSVWPKLNVINEKKEKKKKKKKLVRSLMKLDSVYMSCRMYQDVNSVSDKISFVLL